MQGKLSSQGVTSITESVELGLSQNNCTCLALVLVIGGENLDCETEIDFCSATACAGVCCCVSN